MIDNQHKRSGWGISMRSTDLFRELCETAFTDGVKLATSIFVCDVLRTYADKDIDDSLRKTLKHALVRSHLRALTDSGLELSDARALAIHCGLSVDFEDSEMIRAGNNNGQGNVDEEQAT